MHHHIYKISKPTSSKFWEKLLYRVTIIAGIVSPVMVVPQIYKIFHNHSAAGVSALSWSAFALLDLPFIIYGLSRKDKPIITTYSLFFLGNLMVAIGAIIYK
jgi:uncharacterized protein with PQ loop repeat